MYNFEAQGVSYIKRIVVYSKFTLDSFAGIKRNVNLYEANAISHFQHKNCYYIATIKK